MAYNKKGVKMSGKLCNIGEPPFLHTKRNGNTLYPRSLSCMRKVFNQIYCDISKIDQNQAEILKADIKTLIQYLTEMFNVILETEAILENW